tara:strand:- start:1810 stop:2223 length:414 start_codon:yes stop_codon:yes gene_type:complete
MNEPISWDHTLVKKYSSSNHYKLLNQLRNEVKKYPLNNKKKTTIIKIKDTNIEDINKSNHPSPKNITLSNNSNQSFDSKSNKSTVSFNNAKNFSIYNQALNNKANHKSENQTNDHQESLDVSSSLNFKDRLNKIDMK